MLTLSALREQRDAVIAALAKRGLDAAETIDGILAADAERRATQTRLDGLLAESNAASRKIGELMRSGQREEAEAMKATVSGNKALEKELKDQLAALEGSVHEALCHLPNTPCDLVAAGKSAEDNVEVFRSGELPTLAEGAVPHWDLASKYDLIDFDLGAKVTGAGFPFYKGKGAKLQRGLIRFFLERAEEAGYLEYIPPHMINEESGFGT